MRIEAYQWLALICDEPAIEELVRGLDEADDRVPSAIVTGLARSNHLAQSQVAFALFQPLIALVAKAPPHITEQATTTLLSWHRKRLLRELEQQGILNPGHAAFADVMTAIQESGELLPRERLLLMLRDDDVCRASGPDATALLRMLASHHEPDDRSMLLDLMAQPGPVAGAAATALLTAHHLDGWVAAILNESRRERSEPEQQAFAIWMLDCDLRNGGFRQYFANPSSGHWQSALAGLREADDDERAELLTEARQRSEAADRAHSYTDLDTRYHGLTRPVQVTLTRIILANRQAFRP